MATPDQIAANRRNAQHSTVPRTPEGKARRAIGSHRRASPARSLRSAPPIIHSIIPEPISPERPLT